MSSRPTKSRLMGIAAVAGVIASLALGATQLWQRRIVVDFDSGMIRERECFVVTLSERAYGPNDFGRLVLPSGTNHLTGNSSWHVAASYRAEAATSPYFRSSAVLGQIRQLEVIGAGLSQADAGALKERYLRALNSGGVEAAANVVQEASKLK